MNKRDWPLLWLLFGAAAAIDVAVVVVLIVAFG